MEGMIDQAGEHFTKKIVCVGLAPINESKTVPFILERTISFYSLDRHEYDLALEKMCNRKNVFTYRLEISSFTIIFRRTESTRYLRVTRRSLSEFSRS